MTDLYDRVLAELMKPGPYRLRSAECDTAVVVRQSTGETVCRPEREPVALRICERLNASHRIASILRMIAEDEGVRADVAKSIWRHGGMAMDTGKCDLDTSDLEACHPVGCYAQAALSALLSILPEEK
jgi:hypothetical protein